jgi:hypothetical protein
VGISPAVCGITGSPVIEQGIAVRANLIIKRVW